MGTKNSSGQQLANSKPGSQTPGEMLRRIRIDRGMQIEDVAMQLGLTNRRVTALEENNYEQLPSRVYVRGYIKRYCSILDIAPEPVVAGYEILAENHGDSLPAAVPVEDISLVEAGRRWIANRHRLILITAIVLALLLMWVIQPGDARQVYQPGAEEGNDGVGLIEVPQTELISESELMEGELIDGTIVQQTAKEPETDTIAITMLPVEEVMPVIQTLVVTLGKDSWVEVVDAHHDVLLADLKPAGSVIELQGKAPFEVLLGNAMDARVSYQGSPVPVPVSQQDHVARWVVGK